MKDSGLYKSSIKEAHASSVKANRILLRVLDKTSVRACIKSPAYIAALVQAKGLVAALESVRDINEAETMVY